MNPFRRNAARRYERRIQHGLKLVQDGMSIRKAARSNGVRLPKSTLYYQYNRRSNDARTKRYQLTWNEEEKIVLLLERYARLGRPLRRDDLYDAVELLVSSMPKERRNALRFINGRPGKRFAQGFATRHKHRIKFLKPSMQESIRFTSTNAENLTDHIAKIEKIIADNNIDPSRIVNLDESGITPGKDTCKTQSTKVYGTRSSPPQATHPMFSNVKRITLLAVVFASGDVGRPMFVLNGTRLNYRSILVNGSEHLESLADCLPRGAIITTRKDIAGVDKENFVRYGQQFVKDVSDLTANGRKVLVLYDGYRSHMSLKVLEIFRTGGVIAYALPAHTSGTTQPLDLSCFAPWKLNVRNEISRLTASTTASFDEFDFCRILTIAYRKAFTGNNVLAGFKKSGISPLDPHMLIGIPRPHSNLFPNLSISVEEMFDMLEAKRKRYARENVIHPVVGRSGFLDTSKGLNLTSDEAMKMINAQEEMRQKQENVAKQNRIDKEIKQLEAYQRKKAAREAHIMHMMHQRALKYGDAVVIPRTIKMRRKIAAQREAAKRESQLSKDAVAAMSLLCLQDA